MNMKNLDKIQHAIGCFFIVIIIQALLMLLGVNNYLALVVALIVALVIGFIKEIRDSYFDSEDILADVIGILVAVFLNVLYGFFK